MASQNLPPHLKNEIHVIVSTLSGTGKAPSYYHDTLLPFLESWNLPHIKHETESTKTITNLAKSTFLPQAACGIKQTIILLSGDGGVVDLVNTLASDKTSYQNVLADAREKNYFPPSIVLIPMGTGNALAHSSGVFKDPLGILLNGTPKPLPQFKVSLSPGAMAVTDEGRGREAIPLNDGNGQGIMYGVVVFSWCLHASLVAMSDTEEMRKHDVDRFKIAARTLLQEGHQYQGNLKVLLKNSNGEGDGGEEWIQFSYREPSLSPHAHSYILATLVSNLEEHFTISPLSRPLDGHLRLIAIPAIQPGDIMRILMLAYQGGKHVEDTQVIYEDIGEGLRIEMMEPEEKWRCVCIDGKIVVLEEGGWVEVRRDIRGTPLLELVC
jgi:diacylglycerol kinase family enzyme